MTAMGVVAGQIIARVRDQTLHDLRRHSDGFRHLPADHARQNSTQTTVALYLMITGLGLGPIMPTATLAVQSTVEKSLLGVATSATQFIRSLGSTIGTAVIGSLVT